MAKRSMTLRGSQEAFKTIVDTSLESIYQVDSSGKFMFVNESFATLFGYRREELPGKYFGDMLSAETLPKVEKMVQEVLSGKNVRDKVTAKHKDGHEIPVRFSATPLRERGKVVGLTGVLSDITERKQAEEELRRKEEYYHALIENSSDAISILDADGITRYESPSYERVMGYRLEEEIGKSGFEYIHQDDMQRATSAFARLLQDPSVILREEVRVWRKDGSLRTVEVVGQNLLDNPAIKGIVANYHDITERKQAEEKLRRKEEYYEALIENSLDAISVLDADGIMRYESPSYERVMGYRPEEEIGKSGFEYLYQDDMQRATSAFARLFQDPSVILREEVRAWHKDGSLRTIEVAAQNLLDNPAIKGIVANYRDITERRQAEDTLREAHDELEKRVKERTLELEKANEALQESEAKFRNVLDNSVDMIYRMDLTTGRYDYMSLGSKKLLGYDPDEFISLGSDHAVALIHPDDVDCVSNGIIGLMDPAKRYGKATTIEYRIKHKEMGYRWVSDNVSVIHNEGNVTVAVVGNLRDITDRKITEEALRESENRYRELADLLPQIVFEIDAEGNFTFANRKGFESTGYSQDDFDKGLNISQLLVPEDRERGKENLQLIFNGEESIGTEYTALRKDGTTFPIVVYSSLIIRDNQPAGLRAVAIDVTEQKRAEEALRESEEKGRALLNAPPDSAILTDREGVILDLNEVAAARFGKSRDELIGVCVHDIVPPEVAKGRRAQARKVIRSGMPVRFGDERAGIIFDSTYYPIFDARGRVTRIAIFARDITEHKRAEEALRESEQKFREMANLLPQIVFETDEKGNFTFANRNAFKSTGYTPDDLEKGLNVFRVFVPEDRDRGEKNIQRILGGERLSGNEYTLLRKDGSTFPVIVFSSLIIRENKPVGLRGVVIDITERKRAEEELRKREQYFQALIENSLDAITILNADGTIRYQSPSLERILGYEEGEQVGESGFERVHPDDLPKVAEDFAKLIKNPDYIAQTEIRYPHKDGSWHVIEATGQNLLDDPAVAGIVCNFRDITERKHTAEALRQSEERYRTIVENIRDVIWTTDKDLRYTYLSPTIMRQRGYSVEEAMALGPEDILTPASLEVALKAFTPDAAADNGERNKLIKPRPLELEVYCKNGSTIWTETEVAYIRDSDGQIIGTIGTTRDITERKRAEEALREREEHFKALIENSLEAIAIVDGEGAIQYLGPSFERLMGYELEEYLGKNPFDHVHSDDRSRVAAIFAELMQKPGATVQEEVRVLHKNGSLRTVEVVGQNLLHNPAVGGIVANMRDITERKQAAEKLQALYQQEKDLREQIEKEMKRRVEFTRVLAHELKTPLTSVLASSDLLISEVRDEPLLSLAKNIRQGASNLNSRIDELLDLARGEVGMLQLKREPVDLSHLLREAADSMTPLALGRGQSIILRLPPALPTVQADTTRLQQVVTNLLNNAVKFTPKGGSITLRARKKDASVIVEVQDTGRGIPKREQERLFEPYQRLEEAEENLSGLGLGLSLCKTLVELHGGQIWMRSHVGRGSTFGFSLPLEAADKQATEPEKIAKLWKVLIIEDDQQIVDSVSLTFRLRWPEVQLISTGLGEEGIEMAETEAPDIVILDLGLPDISGFDVLRQIRLFSSVPVVILTVREDESDMVKGLEWGADDYLVKPFKQLELLARLKVQLRKQTPPDEEAPIVCGPLRLEPSTFQLTHGGKEISLTIIEGRIIECLMRNAGHVVTHSRLAETVWGEDYPRALDSLRVYIRYLREKIEANPSKPKIILTKAGVGYSLAKPV